MRLNKDASRVFANLSVVLVVLVSVPLPQHWMRLNGGVSRGFQSIHSWTDWPGDWWIERTIKQILLTNKSHQLSYKFWKRWPRPGLAAFGCSRTIPRDMDTGVWTLGCAHKLYLRQSPPIRYSRIPQFRGQWVGKEPVLDTRRYVMVSYILPLSAAELFSSVWNSFGPHLAKELKFYSAAANLMRILVI